jgi:hypothetical protein
VGLKNPRGWFDSNSDHHLARVAQLIERWSYKPEVEGLSPSSGTKRKEKEKGKSKNSTCESRDFLPFYYCLSTFLLGA